MNQIRKIALIGGVMGGLGIVAIIVLAMIMASRSQEKTGLLECDKAKASRLVGLDALDRDQVDCAIYHPSDEVKAYEAYLKLPADRGWSDNFFAKLESTGDWSAQHSERVLASDVWASPVYIPWWDPLPKTPKEAIGLTGSGRKMKAKFERDHVYVVVWGSITP